MKPEADPFCSVPVISPDQRDWVGVWIRTGNLNEKSASLAISSCTLSRLMQTLFTPQTSPVLASTPRLKIPKPPLSICLWTRMEFTR